MTRGRTSPRPRRPSSDGATAPCSIATDPFHEARCLAIASSLGLTPFPTPTRTSPIKGFSTIPYYAKETVGVALGRIIGFDHLSALHSSLG